MQLTSNQLAAIDTVDRHLGIVACAGSGKTEVIARRVVKLLRLPGVEPRHIVAFTFTDRAAGELKQRIVSRVREELGDVRGLAELFVGTMHGYALSMLQSQVPETFKCTVLSDVQARVLIDRNSRASGLTTTQIRTKGKPTRPMKRYVNSPLYQRVLGMLREDEIDQDGLPSDVLDGLSSYRALLQRLHYLDYSEILRLAADLLLPPPSTGGPATEPVVNLRAHVRDTVRYVVVDEYQDTNPVQEQLIAGLVQFRVNLCVVGDDDQTIYQWRGSAVNNILTFTTRHSSAKTVTLNENFRSSKAVVDLARRVAEGIDPSRRLSKSMIASGHQSYDRGDLLALSFGTPQEEAAWICDRIEWMIGLPFTDRVGAPPRGLANSDFAVLFRSVSGDADPLVMEMRARGIRYIIKGLSRLFQTPEVQAAKTCFDYIAEAVDGDAVVTAWTDARLGLREEALKRGVKMLDGARGWAEGMPWDTYTIQGTYQRFLGEVGVREEHLTAEIGRERSELAFYNLGRFSTAIGDYERIHFLSNHPTGSPPSPSGWSTRLATTTRRVTPTPDTPGPTPLPSPPSTRPRACSGRRCSCPVCAATASPANGRADSVCSTSSRRPPSTTPTAIAAARTTSAGSSTWQRPAPRSTSPSPSPPGRASSIRGSRSSSPRRPATPTS